MIYSNIQLITLIALGVALIFGVISLYKKSYSPLSSLKEITAGLSIFFGLLALILYFNIFWYAVIFFSVSWIYGSGIHNKSMERRVRRKSLEWRGVAPLDRESSSNSGCIWLAGIIGVGAIMYLVFKEYLNFTIRSNTKSTAFDIMLILFVFCTILCLTAWGLSLIVKNFISNDQFGFAATSFSVQNYTKKTNGNKIRDLISNGNFEEAINELEKMSVSFNDKELGKTAILMKAKWSNIEKDYYKGQISLEELRVEKARISEIILNLVE